MNRPNKYPVELCTQMMQYAGLGARGKTDEMKASEIKEALSVFFYDDVIEEAQEILTTKGWF